MTVAALDFETANSERGSACSVGVVLYKNGKEISSYYQLIRPSSLYFDPFHVSIHGITAEDVRDQPEFDVVWREIQEFVGDAQLLAHNASFDMSVLRHALDRYQLLYPEVEYSCTCNIARKAWPDLHSHKLNIVCDYLGIEFDHHNALEDARACGEIFNSALDQFDCNSVKELSRVLNFGIGKLFPGGYSPAKRTRPARSS